MHLSAEAPQFDLLALACLNRQGVRVDPLIRRYVSRLGGVREDIEDRRLVDNGQKGDCRYDLLQNISYFGLNF